MMEREIKFRFWCTDGEMSRPFKLQEMTGKENWDKLVPMQYIGLKDKSGKEIYEGDVVMEPTRYRTEKRVLNWDDWQHGHTYAHTWEVIGNIYENPELLKED